MKKKTSKARFWLILVALNILAFAYPVGLLINGNDESTKLFAAILLMTGFLIAALVDTVSVLFAYWL